MRYSGRAAGVFPEPVRLNVWLSMRSVALAAPRAIGANLTVNGTVPPGGTSAGSLGRSDSVNTEFAPRIVMLLIGAAVVPVLPTWNRSEEELPTAAGLKLTVPPPGSVVEIGPMTYE